MAETTLVIVKPDAVDRGLIGEIISRLERAGLIIVGCNFTFITLAQANEHYHDLAERRSPRIKELAVGYLTSGPSLVLAVYGSDAIARVKKLVGATDPAKAAPGTIRADFAVITMADSIEADVPLINLVHCSDPDFPEDAERELGIYFGEFELIPPYLTAGEAFLGRRRW
jgi:nucleoside-diphosphate kinase